MQDIRTRVATKIFEGFGGAILWFRNPYFYFQQGESTSTASQLTSPASPKSKDLNKVPLLLQDLGMEAEDYMYVIIGNS